MRRSLRLLLVVSPVFAACTAQLDDEVRVRTTEDIEVQSAGNWAGGGGTWGGGGSQWGGGGGMFGGGGGWWGGGGSWWGGGGGMWGGGGGQWGGGGGYWGGGGNWWGGGGSWWGGGGSMWGGGGGMWGGGYASTFPFVGWSESRHWQFRGVPKAGFNPTTPPAFALAKDTTSCKGGKVRLGGFAYPIQVEGWPAYAALGFNKALCISTPGGDGLTMNPTVATSSLTPDALLGAGGYALTGDVSNYSRDANAMKTMVGFGNGNVATQYGGALCASIGSLAASKRNCGLGIAFSDVNHKQDGSLSPRGVTMNAAQAGSFSTRTFYGTSDGYSLYGATAADKSSYANRVLQKYVSAATNKLPALPTDARNIDGWNSGAFNASTGAANSYSMKGTDFAAIAETASPDAAKLRNDANRSVTAPLNMVPVDSVSSTSTDPNTSVAQTDGELHLLNLHSLALHQAPLYGSGAGRWFFHNPSDPAAASKPLMDLSSIFQSTTYIMTGRLSALPTTTNTSTTVSQAFISPLELTYTDWRREPTSGTLYVDRAGQNAFAGATSTDAEKGRRLQRALRIPQPNPNIGLGRTHSCAITSAGGAVKCWGNNLDGELGNGSTVSSSLPVTPVGLTAGAQQITGGYYHTCALMKNGGVKCWGAPYPNNTIQTVPTDVVGLSSGVASIAAGISHTCAVMVSGGVKCWGYNYYGQLGNGTTTNSAVPVDVTGLTGVVALSLGDGHSCALTEAGEVKCWGANNVGQLGLGNNTDVVLTPGPTALTGAAAVAAGAEITCALTRAGGVKCWGRNEQGAIGDGSAFTYTDPKCVYARHSPTDVVGLSSGVVALSTENYHTCAVLKNGGAKCWGRGLSGELGNGTTSSTSTPVDVSGLSSGVSSVDTGIDHTCARLTDGSVKCWGGGRWGQIGDGSTSTTPRLIPTAVSSANGSLVNGSPMESQGSVLIHYAGGTNAVTGHITPIPWSMTNSTEGTQALMVTYDPLAAAAAMFIEQYDAHIAACNATTSETMTEADQKAGSKLWACSNATSKTNYKNGMLTLLNGARHYLFGYDDGCIQSTQTVAGVACATTKIDVAQAHFPYTFVVPDYTTSAYNSTYYGSLNTDLTSYRTAVIGSSSTYRLERTLQLAGIQKFTTNDAIVTSRLVRSGQTQSNPLDCVANDGFTAKLQ